MRFRVRVLPVLPVLLIGLAASFAAQADCAQPVAPTDIPTGRDVREQELVSAMHSVREYSTHVDAYLQCLDAAAKQSQLSVPVAERLHNDAVDELYRVANRFNTQVRIFKSKEG